MSSTTVQGGAASAVWRWILLLVVLAVATAARLPLLELEFGRNADGTGTLYSLAARNYLLRDNLPTLWMPVISVGDAASPPTVYAHHPPGVPLLMALSLLLFGDHTPAHRLPAAVFTVLTSGALFLLLTRPSPDGSAVSRARLLTASATATLLAVSPLAVRFGQMPDVVNSQLVFFMLLTLHLHLRVIERPTPARGAAAVAAMLAAALTDWPAFFLFLVLFAHALLRRRWAWAAVLAVVSVLLFASLASWASLAAGDWGLLPRQFANRSIKSSTDDLVPFTWADWLGYAVAVTVRQLGPLLALAAAIGVVAAALQRHASVRTAVLLLACTAFLHAVVGRQAAFNHDWWWWPVSAALLLAAGGLLTTLRPPLLAATVSAVLLGGTGYAGFREYQRVTSDAFQTGAETHYTLPELADVVRRHTPPNRTVLLFQDDLQPYVLYHLRRPVIQRVWDAESFNAALHATTADLFYTFRQTLNPAQAPAVLVIPAVYAPKAAGLLGHVRGRFPEIADGKFLVFLLDDPPARPSPAARTPSARTPAARPPPSFSPDP
ncbi:MAG: glycosyltransferase family 39 protein [Tepidisphaerales bacterium]